MFSFLIEENISGRCEKETDGAVSTKDHLVDQFGNESKCWSSE